MKEQLSALRREASEALQSIDNLAALDQLRVQYLGKKGALTAMLKGMGKLSAEERPVIGQLANEIRDEISAAIEAKKGALEAAALQDKLAKETIDISLEPHGIRLGHVHPLVQTTRELEDLFIRMGFTVMEGPEIETVENNFDALNSPENHPSRDMSDTFYFNAERLLRTQTSPVQIRSMREHGAPIRMVCSGRTFRFDDVDDTHSPMFHQFEGLVVDKGVTMANLIETLDLFVKELFGADMKTRYRPHYFPFTEPSAEVDVTCHACHGKGCPACHGTGWSMELLGCGMVHPKVLENCGIDPEVYSGFAFGMGIDRITMVKYGIRDIRLLFENDDRFLAQF